MVFELLYHKSHGNSSVQRGIKNVLFLTYNLSKTFINHNFKNDSLFLCFIHGHLLWRRVEMAINPH